MATKKFSNPGKKFQDPFFGQLPPGGSISELPGYTGGTPVNGIPGATYFDAKIGPSQAPPINIGPWNPGGQSPITGFLEQVKGILGSSATSPSVGGSLPKSPPFQGPGDPNAEHPLLKTPFGPDGLGFSPQKPPEFGFPGFRDPSQGQGSTTPGKLPATPGTPEIPDDARFLTQLDPGGGSDIGSRVDENGQEWIQVPGYGEITADDAHRFSRDYGYDSFESLFGAVGSEAVGLFERWQYNQFNGPELSLAPYLGFKVDENGTGWIVLPDGRGQWDTETADDVAEMLGYDSVGQMFSSINHFDKAVQTFNDALYDMHNDPWAKMQGFLFGQALGVPYVWGGADLNGFDCSGLVQWAFGLAGKPVPGRTAQDQYNGTQRIGANDLQEGDLVFYGDPNGGIYHVAIYIGDGQIIHAPSAGDSVKIQDLYGNPSGFGRVS